MVWYAVLGVKQTASKDDITKAYRAKARIFHPDVNPNGAEQFKLLTQAYNEAMKQVKTATFSEKNSAFAGRFEETTLTLRELFTGAQRTFIYKDARIRVRIPPGAHSGEVFVFPEGDLTLKVFIDYENFSCKSDVLHYPLWLLPSEFLFGCTKEIPLPVRPVQVRVKPGVMAPLLLEGVGPKRNNIVESIIVDVKVKPLPSLSPLQQEIVAALKASGL